MKKLIIILVGGLVALLVLVTCNQKKEQTNPASNIKQVQLAPHLLKSLKEGPIRANLMVKRTIRKLLIQALSSIQKLKLKSLPKKLAKERKRRHQLLVWI